MFDVAIIGGGPGGYSSAIEAAKSGLSVVLFEKNKLGGTCLNVGCIPTKYLLDKAQTIEGIRNLTSKSIFKEAGLFSYKKIQEGKEQVVGKLTGGVAFLLKKLNVTVVSGEASFRKLGVVSCNGKDYETKNVIIATGAETVRIPIPGADLCIDSTQCLNLPKVPTRMTVIGGGVIGLELGSAFASFGTKVTIIEMLEKLLPRELPEVSQYLTRVLKQRGCEIITSSKVLGVEKKDDGFATSYEENGVNKLVDGDVVLMAIGRKAIYPGVDVQTLGLEMSPKKTIIVNDRMETNLKGVYAIGDVIGRVQLAHAAYAEGAAVVKTILGHPENANLDSLPRCVYTQPCVAAVGLTMDQAKEKGYTPALGSFDYAGNGMALAEGAAGVVYAIMDKSTQTTLGFQIVGNNASEIIGLATGAVEKKFSLTDWEKIVIAHPSLSEMLKEAALDAFGKAVHKI